MAADMVLAGDKPAICITEPEAGSDANGMTTRADKKGNRYVVNGRKHWITGGGVSRLHLIFAKVFDEKGNEEGIGGFLAIRDETVGLKITKREPTMGLRGIPEGGDRFRGDGAAALGAGDPAARPQEGLRRPDDRLQQPARRRRHGWRWASPRAPISSRSTGSEKRHQFGRPINEFQGLQWKLADMSIKLSAAQALVYNAARSGEGGFPDMLLAAQAKVFTSENAIQVVNDALQFFGARGYSRELPLERMARDVRMFTIGGGTAEVLRTVVAGALFEEEAAAERATAGASPRLLPDRGPPGPPHTLDQGRQDAGLEARGPARAAQRPNLFHVPSLPRITTNSVPFLPALRGVHATEIHDG